MVCFELMSLLQIGHFLKLAEHSTQVTREKSQNYFKFKKIKKMDVTYEYDHME